MKQRHYWLLALLSVLTFMMTTTLVCAEDLTKGHVEVGISGMDVDDNPARVNEYVQSSDEDQPNVNPALDLKVEHIGEDVSAEVELDYDGSDSYDMSFGADIKRILRFKLDYQKLKHWKDHETLDQMGATARDDIGGSQPNVTTDKIYADLIEATGNDAVTVGGANLIDPVTGALAYDPEEAWEQEISNDYIVTRKELKSEVDLAIPELPNIVFHAGLRIETREGMEQSVSLSKCGGCHVSAAGKDIDERTEEYTMGATGKFGKVTVDYEYMTRDFSEQADAPSRWYMNPAPDAGGLVKASSLLYDTDKFDYARTPDSEKDSHMINARVDFTSKTILSGSFVNADIESTKTDEPGIYELDDTTLDSEYTGYNGKLATAIGPVRLSLRGGYYEIDGAEYTVTYDKRDDPPDFGRPQTHEMDNEQEYVSAESREVTEFGIDAVYRLTKATTLRLGYEYEKIERDEDELGETETNTLKASIKTRFGKTLSGRVSYEFQDIDEPFVAHNATGIAQDNPDDYDSSSGLAALDAAQFQGIDGNDNWVYYWNSVYPSRGFDATNQPDVVHEGKLSTTWAPQTNMAATFYVRGRYEENDDVHYEQSTIVPGVSLWFAPSDKLNLTASYMYSYQNTENRACVGWYHG
ncbi:MAG: hypothetical protein DRP70_16945 [Spirochaetes bacterium]|nr:MAG: hypothetical protein DRP70_16945 [Spirochaetota bacterium]